MLPDAGETNKEKERHKHRQSNTHQETHRQTETEEKQAMKHTAYITHWPRLRVEEGINKPQRKSVF